MVDETNDEFETITAFKSLADYEAPISGISSSARRHISSSLPKLLGAISSTDASKVNSERWGQNGDNIGDLVAIGYKLDLRFISFQTTPRKELTTQPKPFRYVIEMRTTGLRA